MSRNSASSGRCPAERPSPASAWPSAISVMLRPRCQSRMVSAGRLPAGLQPGDDLAELGMEIRLGQLVRIDMPAQRPEGQPLAALPPIIHHHLVHDVGEGELDGAHGAVGHDEGAGLDPFGLEQRLGGGQARGLHHDIRPAHAALPIRGHLHLLAEIGREALGEGIPALRPAGMDPDLVEIEQAVEKPDVPIGRARGPRYGPAPSTPAGRDIGRPAPSRRRCASR